MKISIKDSNLSFVTFDDIPLGDIFEYNGYLYMKCKTLDVGGEYSITYNAVNLHGNNIIYFVESTSVVELQQPEITVRYKYR